MQDIVNTVPAYGSRPVSVLISGNNPRVKAQLIGSQFVQARSSCCITVVISFDGNDGIESMMRSCGISSVRRFLTGRDTYVRCFDSTNDELRFLRDSARADGYKAPEISGMISLCMLLEEIDSLGPLAKNGASLGELLSKYRTLQSVAQHLFTLVSRNVITRDQAAYYNGRFEELAASGMTADNLLAAASFTLRGNGTGRGFSLSEARRGEGCVLYTSYKRDTFADSEMIGQWTEDILRLSDCLDFHVLFLAGDNYGLPMVADAAERLSGVRGVSVTVCSRDIFSGCMTEQGRNMARRFVSVFPYCVFGAHPPVSARFISELFGESVQVPPAGFGSLIGGAWRKAAAPRTEPVLAPEKLTNLYPGEYITMNMSTSEIMFGVLPN